ncbi:hypothetical protein TNCV_3047781 [Trichonephila clavipes]|nr:hypothetical protein TNCV_3047781 [Trichonephila clavipes]
MQYHAGGMINGRTRLHGCEWTMTANNTLDAEVPTFSHVRSFSVVLSSLDSTTIHVHTSLVAHIWRTEPATYETVAEVIWQLDKASDPSSDTITGLCLPSEYSPPPMGVGG